MDDQPLPLGERIYVAYRKIRFLLKRGSLFSIPGKRPQSDEKYTEHTFYVIALNSSLLFLLSYLLTYTINLVTTGIVAISFNIPVVVYFNTVDFLIRGNDWTSDAVIAVFSSGPLVALLISITLIILYLSVSAETGMLRLLVVWMLFHELTRFFGEMLTGAIMEHGFGYVIQYLFIMDTGKLIITIFASIAMFSFGLIFARLFLFTANIYFNDLRSGFRDRFIVSQFFIPFFIGNILIFIIKLPEISLFDMATNASMALLLIPLYVRGLSVENLYFDEDERKIKISIPAILITSGFLLVTRIVLGIGIKI
jgi:hypothetical protein